jgi:heterodisulfide reductase subunit A-like polyferredoxin
MTTTATARKVFKVLGTTDEITECEHCGRTELKGTIRLGELDEDGNVEGITYFGAVCGARAAGWTTKEIRKSAAAADRAAAEAARIERQRKADEEYAASVLLRYTDQCPLAPERCRYDRRGCPIHGDAPRKVYAD